MSTAAGEMPSHLLHYVPAEWSEPGDDRIRARERHRVALAEWCAAKGHSYAMTALGWRRPSPDEEAAGQVTVPDGWWPGRKIARPF